MVPTGSRSNKKAHESPSSYNPKVIVGQPRDLVFARISKSKTAGGFGVAVLHESPWDTFTKIYECDLGGVVEVVARRPSPRGVYSLRRLPGKDLQYFLEQIGSLRHDNVACALEYFYTVDSIYVLGDFYPLTLGHVVASKAFRNEAQLTAIMSQVRSATHQLALSHLVNDKQILDGSSYLISVDLRPMHI